eukprot:m.38026 g.38026  ORF g.38026 m.38026 type:complete len:318 (-) comp10148_c0_seq2:179-1132(-)
MASNGTTTWRKPVKHDPSLPPHKRRYHFHEVPLHQQCNPYIVTGYRAFLDYSQCTKTLFAVSNETVNMWTHFLGVFWALYHCYYINYVYFPSIADQRQDVLRARLIWGVDSDKLALNLYVLGTIGCLFSSGCFHLFNCHNHKESNRWLQYDLLGITLAMIGCFFPGIQFGFFCYPWHCTFYMCVTAINFVFNLVVQSHPDFLLENHTWRMRRVLLFGATLGLGVVPTAHWTWLNWHDTNEMTHFLPNVIYCYAIMGLGAFFYVSRFPERANPGGFDLLFASHQWWHVCVWLSLWWWLSSSYSLFDHRLATPCPNPVL